MRLDRFVSNGMSISRREVSGWIRAGRVLVNGAAVREPKVHVVPSNDLITVDGEVLRPPGHLTLMMHKPEGCISATESDEHETVLDHVPAGLRRRKLAPVGRLDKDTTGLLLLTTDGGLNHYLTHPKYKVDKAYLAQLREPLLPDAAARFAAGWELADGTRCKPAKLESLAPLLVRVVVHEGRFHQVKRMLGTVNGHVVALHRERVGLLTLDAALAAGQCRILTPAEWQLLDATLPTGRAVASWDPPAGHQPRGRRQRARRGEKAAALAPGDGPAGGTMDTPG